MSLLLVPLALATPEGSAYRAALTPVCTSDVDVVFLLQESDHDGTYYGAQTALRWARYDVISRRWRFVPLLEVHEYGQVDPGQEARAPERQVGKGALADMLGPASRCMLSDPAANDDFTYVIGAAGLSLSWGSASRALEAREAWTFDAVGGQPAPSENVEMDCTLAEARTFDAPGGLTLVVSRGSVCDTDGHPLRVFTVSTSALAHTKSVTLNQAGLDALRAGQIAEAILDFSAALLHDRTNTTATYNLACAYARSGDSASAVGVLSRLPKEGLAVKLRSDRDFDGVRSNPGFAEFVAGL